MLGAWYAALVFIDRRKCLLFVNDKTLLNFLIPDVPRRQIRELDKLFLGFLQCILSDEGFDRGFKARIQSEYRSLNYSEAENKSMRATISDLELRYKLLIRAEGGICYCNLPEIIHKMNQTPLPANGQVYPVDAVRKLFEAQTKAA